MRHFEPQILVFFSPRGFSTSNVKACLWCMFILSWCPWRLAKLLLMYTLVPFGMLALIKVMKIKSQVGSSLLKKKKQVPKEVWIVVIWDHNIVKPKHMCYMETTSNMLQWASSPNYAMNHLGFTYEHVDLIKVKRPSFKPTLSLALPLSFGTFVHKNKFILVFKSHDQHMMLYYNSSIFAKLFEISKVERCPSLIMIWIESVKEDSRSLS